MKFRITVRSDNIELRGYIEHPDPLRASRLISDLGEAAKPFDALVIASPVDDTYNPFDIWDNL
jgi:hypothetical protein